LQKAGHRIEDVVENAAVEQKVADPRKFFLNGAIEVDDEFGTFEIADVNRQGPCEAEQCEQRIGTDAVARRA